MRALSALGGYIGCTSFTNNPLDTPCETFNRCNTGAAVLLDPRSGIAATLVAGAISVMLGAGASFDATTAAPAGLATLLLITMGCADSFGCEGLLAATLATAAEAFDGSMPALSLLERTGVFAALVTGCVSDDDAVCCANEESGFDCTVAEDAGVEEDEVGFGAAVGVAVTGCAATRAGAPALGSECPNCIHAP